MPPCRNHPGIETGCQACSRCGEWFCDDCRVVFDGVIHCAGCKVEHLRDLHCGVPVGGMELATTSQRFAAFFLDSLLFVALLTAVMFWGAAMFPEGGSGSDLLPVAAAVLLPRVVYEALFLRMKGQTLGKMALRIRVVTPQGGELRAVQAWGRALTRLVFDGCIWIVNYFPAFVTEQRTCLHDLICSTRVTRLERWPKR
ncbi:MAG: RDD family protein [bacterium]|nr:RDD family protein [bacterium]